MGYIVKLIKTFKEAGEVRIMDKENGKFPKTGRWITLIIGSALMLNACGGGGSSSSGSTPQPSQPDELRNTLYSVNGTAKLIFKDGVVLENSNLRTQSLNDLGVKDILVPHTGASSIKLVWWRW